MIVKSSNAHLYFYLYLDRKLLFSQLFLLIVCKQDKHIGCPHTFDIHIYLSCKHTGQVKETKVRTQTEAFEDTRQVGHKTSPSGILTVRGNLLFFTSLLEDGTISFVIPDSKSRLDICSTCSDDGNIRTFFSRLRLRLQEYTK